MPEPLKVTIEHANCPPALRNFKGEEGPYNRKGDKNFLVIIEPDDALHMAAQGWNIKQFKEREEGVPGDYYLQVAVKYEKYPPRINMITSSGTTLLNNDTVVILDELEFANVDMILTGSYWENNGKTGYKAYVKNMYVTILEDELDRKYSMGAYNGDS